MILHVFLQSVGPTIAGIGGWRCWRRWCGRISSGTSDLNGQKNSTQVWCSPTQNLAKQKNGSRKSEQFSVKMHALIFWNLWMKLASKMHGSGRLPWLGSQGWKRNRSEVRSCSPAAVPWRAKSCGTTAAPGNMANAANSDFVWRWALIKEAPEVAKEDRGQSGNMSQGIRFGLPRINSYKWYQCIQRDPSGSRPHDLEDWQELIGAIEFALDREAAEPHVLTSLMSSSQKFTLGFACSLLKFVFFDACAVLGTWPSPNKLHERFVLGVQVVLRKTQSRWHCSNPSTPARQTSGGRGWEPSLRTRNCASPLRIFAKRVGWCFFYAWPKFVTHTHTQRERTSPVPAAI